MLTEPDVVRLVAAGHTGATWDENDAVKPVSTTDLRRTGAEM